MFPRAFSAPSSALFLICLIGALATTAFAADVTVTWDANGEPDVVGYRLFYGTESQPPTEVNVTGPMAVASDLSEGETYYFAAIAYNIDGIESELSDEISYTVPVGPPGPTPTPTATATGSPTPTPPPFARDPFDDLSSVNITSRPMVTGQTWIVASSWPGTILTAGGSSAYSTEPNAMDVITTDMPSANYTVSANVTYATFNGWDIGVVGRANAAGNNGYLAEIYVTNGGATQTLNLYKIMSTSPPLVSLGSYVLSGSDLLTLGSAGEITLSMSGSTIAVKWKGTQRISVTNTVYTAAGRAGIWSGIATSTTGPQFQDFTATLGSSSGTPSPTPTATATATPTATLPPGVTPSPTPTATLPPGVTPSPTPTATATATPASTPSPSPTATPEGPFGGLVNVSTRARVTSGEDVLIGGFIITGDIPRTVVLRGMGPSLTRSGVANAATDPVLTLFDSTGAVLATNDDWDTQDPALIATGLTPTEPLESMLLETLPAGAYTVVLETKGGPGVGLFELYQLSNNMASGLANLSTRGRVGLGDDVMIAGFILAGDHATTVIVRAIGPSLSQVGIAQPLANPELELHDGNGSLIFRNDEWRSDQEAQLVQLGLAPADDQESAMIATLPAGNYSAVVRGVGGSEGVALVEIYALQ